MTNEEAEKILNVSRGTSRREIDTAYFLNRDHCMLRARFDTCPQQRDHAHQAMALVNDAYRSLTGDLAPPKGPNNEMNKTESGDNIPRASLSGRVSPPAPSKPDKRLDWLGVRLNLNPKPNPERLAASLICIAMFTLSLLLLAYMQK